jgi:hypothetical protein
VSFLAPLGLLVALAIVGPLVAHLLRRRRPEERPFPAARLVPTAPPVARRRAHLEDRGLLSLRALSILALALLAASPLVRCTRVSLDRKGGASVALAIVIDDSMSMRAALDPSARRSGARTRFELAVVAARELASALRPGDSTTVILAGAPARVALAATQEAGAVRATLERIGDDGGSDRATDLDAAIAIAAAALAELPQPDKRIVLLSDLAGPGGPIVLPEGRSMTLEAPLEALRTPPPGAPDCALVAAAPEGATVRVRASCAEGGARGRSVEIVGEGGKSLGSASLPEAPPPPPATFELTVPVSSPVTPRDGEGALVRARLVGTDAIEQDDATVVLGAASAPAIAVVVGEGGAVDELVATGGAPIVERALSALQSGVAVRPIPSVPDREEDLRSFSALAIDDPAGFGPDARRAIGAWVERGGVLLVGLGPHAASPPLGASFEPFLARAVRWERVTKPLGVDPTLAGPFGEGAEAPSDLAPRGRTLFDPEDLGRSITRSAFADRAPLLVSRALGQGEFWFSSLPFSAEISDLPVRPAFLALLDAFVARARDRGAGARLPAGEAWSVGPDDTIEAVALDADGRATGKPLPVDKGGVGKRIRPSSIGAYLVTITTKGGQPRRDVRVVVPHPAELEMRPRTIGGGAAATTPSGLSRSTAELGPLVAIVVVVIAAIELIARAFRLARRASDGNDDASSGEPA